MKVKDQERADDALTSPPVPVAMVLKQAGLTQEGQNVRVVTDQPPPVRKIVPKWRKKD